jgi:hypothetical protein
MASMQWGGGDYFAAFSHLIRFSIKLIRWMNSYLGARQSSPDVNKNTLQILWHFRLNVSEPAPHHFAVIEAAKEILH